MFSSSKPAHQSICPETIIQCYFIVSCLPGLTTKATIQIEYNKKVIVKTMWVVAGSKYAGCCWVWWIWCVFLSQFLLDHSVLVNKASLGFLENLLANSTSSSQLLQKKKKKEKRTSVFIDLPTRDEVSQWQCRLDGNFTISSSLTHIKPYVFELVQWLQKILILLIKCRS